MIRPAIAANTRELASIERRALIAGVVGIGCCTVAAIFSWQHFVRAYLVAWIFWGGLSLGALALLMIQYITGGAWGLVLRKFLEAAAGNLLLIALLFVGLVPALPALYEWARPESVAESPLLQHKSQFLNANAFMIRATIYFISWITIAWLLNSWSRRQEADQRTGQFLQRCRAISGPGLVVYGATVTFASIDWVMSLEPAWYSTIFPPLFAVGQILSALAFAVLALMIAFNSSSLQKAIPPQLGRDLGNLLMSFVMIWAYMSFSQFMIIWSENLPEEIPWYLKRIRGGWQWIAISLVLLQFALPFLVLLSREAKVKVRSLLKVAALILCMRFVDLVWWIEAAFGEPLSFYLLVDVAALVAIGGMWVWLFVRHLRRSPLLPIGDPLFDDYLPEAAL